MKRLYIALRPPEMTAYCSVQQVANEFLRAESVNTPDAITLLFNEAERRSPNKMTEALETYERKRRNARRMADFDTLKRIMRRLEKLPEEKTKNSEGYTFMLRTLERGIDQTLMEPLRIEYNAGPADGNYGPNPREFKLEIEKGEPEENRFYAS